MEPSLPSRSKLCLAIDVGDAAHREAVDVLAAALGAGQVASVIVRPAAGSDLQASIVEPFVEAIQRAGAAALIEGAPELVRTVKADGAHVPWSKDPLGAYREARASLGERYIVGADAGRSRHDAMSLGEAGADYVAFGIPAHVGDRTTAEARQIELMAWWSDIFEIPGLAADVTTAEHVRALADVGTDFISVVLPTDATADSAAALIESMSLAMTAPEVTA